jgi:hypothetical protein
MPLVKRKPGREDSAPNTRFKSSTAGASTSKGEDWDCPPDWKEDCESQRECFIDFSKCQIVPRYKQTPRKVCAYN